MPVASSWFACSLVLSVVCRLYRILSVQRAELKGQLLKFSGIPDDENLDKVGHARGGWVGHCFPRSWRWRIEVCVTKVNLLLLCDLGWFWLDRKCPEQV